MPVDFNVKGAASLNSRLYVSDKHTIKNGFGQPLSITLRKPSMRETFFRRLRNVLTFGAWTPLVSNRRDWQAFRKAVTFQAFASVRGNDSPPRKLSAEETQQIRAVLDAAFASYSTSARLTSSKAVSIKAAIDKGLEAGAQALKPAPEGGPTKLSQGILPRVLHTIDQRRDGRANNNNVGRLDQELVALGTELEELKLGPRIDIDLSFPDEDEAGLPRPPLSPQEQERFDLQSRRDQLAIDVATAQKILKLGYPVEGSQIAQGLLALQAQNGARADASLIFPGSSSLKDIGLHEVRRGAVDPCADHLDEVAELLRASPEVATQLKDPPPTSSIVAIPLGLQGGRSITHETHSVLVALDLKSRQVLYLDAKGESPRAAERHYANTQGLQESLERLGRTVFGEAWNPATGMAMLSNAKQQGANDCFAFTHEFTRRLLEGQQLGDIDRSMGELDRDGRGQEDGDAHRPGTSELDGIRARMARDIFDHVLRPNIDDLKARVAQSPVQYGSEANRSSHPGEEA